MFDLEVCKFYEAVLRNGDSIYVLFTEENNILPEEEADGCDVLECIDEDNNIRYVYYCDENCKEVLKTKNIDGEILTLEIEDMIMSY
jgi:hypothetical protein